MNRYRSLLLILVSLAFWPARTTLCEEPEGLDEIVSAWKSTIRSDSERLWMQFDRDWQKREGLEIDYDFDGELESVQYIYSPPVFLKKSVVYRDGEFLSEAVSAANGDYAFHLLKTTKDGPYQVKWLGVGANAGDERTESSISVFVKESSVWRVSRGASNLIEVIPNSPEAFALVKPTGSGDTTLRIEYDRAKAKQLADLGSMSAYSEGEIFLSPVPPWLPVSMRFRYDVDGKDSFLNRIDFDAEGRSKTSTTFTLKNVPMAATKETYDLQSSNNEMLALTRLSAYGIPEPDLPSSFGSMGLILCVAGLLIFAIGFRAVRGRRQT